VDTVAPTLVSQSPTNGEANVGVNSNIVLVFNENVVAGAAGKTITLSAATGN